MRARSTGRCRSSLRTRPRTARRSGPATSWPPGTISGPTPGSEGSLIELTSNAAFLEDGDEVVLRGRAGELELGEVRGRVLPAA